jgi:hypothetical protein
VAIALANKIKSKLYQSDIPELENVRANLSRRIQGTHTRFCTSNFVSDQMIVNQSVSPSSEDVQANLIARLVEILVQTQSFTSTHLAGLATKNDVALTAINNINTVHDHNMFVAFNLRHFTPPPDWKFEVCASYYDTVNFFSNARCIQLTFANLGCPQYGAGT